MTTPITPPTELVAQWTEKAEYWEGAYEKDIATQAAQWGADQELEACCKQVAEWQEHWECKEEHLRAARRPKPPSLKEQAYGALDAYIYGERDAKDKERTYNIIRRALEALPE